MKEIFTLLLLFLLSYSATLQAGVIIVKFTGDDLMDGTIGCSIWNNKKGFPSKPQKALKKTKAIKDKDAYYCLFESMQPGEYAVGAIHDKNDNKKMDKNFLGVPQEAWGVSNNIRPHFSAPEFSDAKFIFRGNKKEINITLLD